jgi:hypothetical protein
MCNIQEISEEKDKLIRNIDKTLTMSGANIITVRKEIEVLEKKADENIRKLSFLL